MLLRTKEFKNSVIVRTRDQEILDQLDVQCDVGAVYDPENYRFDHHQKSFQTTWDDFKKEKEEAPEENKEGDEKTEKKPEVRIRLSSAGLVYKFFGKEVISQICSSEYGKTFDAETLEYLHEKLYKKMIKEIDAIDNGVNIGSNTNYEISTDLGYRISCFNLPWNAPKDQGLSQHNQFKKAMKVAEQ